MVAIPVKILVCVSLFSVDRGVCLPFTSGVMSISKKAMDPSSLESSHVKWMLSSIELRCCKKVCLCALWMMMKVSSTNLFQRVGGVGAVDSALISRSSMKKLATIGLMGDPIAAPSTCPKNFPWKVKYVVLRQNFRRQEIWFTVILVLRCRLLSSSSNFLIISIDGSIGTDVNRDSTSKDIIHSSDFNWMPSILCMKSILFFT